jgi:hypothetical protein
VVLLLASQQSQLHALIAVLIFGLVVGVFGHIIQSRALIITGILVIGLVSVYFLAVAEHLSGS